MPAAPSLQDSYDVGKAEMVFRRPDLLVADGDVTDAFLFAVAAMADLVLRFGAQAFRETFIDGASGDALTALVDDHLNIQRNPATAAQVTVRFSRAAAGGSEPAGTILAGTTIATEYDANGNEVQFTTDVDLVFGLGVLGPLFVEATAVETGREGNVADGTIVRVVDTPVFDASFQVNNEVSAGGGNAEESDEALRARARSFFLTLRRGTLAALEFGALEVDTVRVALATENTVTGIVTVTVTDEDGNSTAQMVSDVETELENWRCAGVPVNVTGGVPLLVDVAFTIAAFRAGYDVAANASLLESAVEARIRKLRGSETLYLDSLIAAIIAVAPDDIYDVTITSPAADVVPLAGQVIRPGTITAS